MENEFERIEYLPLGSVVVVRGNVKKTMIIARGMITKINGEMKFFDYGGVLYPEGLLGEEIVYFNHKDIVEIYHKGFADDDERLMVDNINDWIERSKLTRGEPYDINMQRLKMGKMGK